MPSFDVINYSLRPAKSIQQQLVFDGIRRLGQELGFDDTPYIGLSSVWFTDFILAHKVLGIRQMISIEREEIALARARFNRPFRTVTVEEGEAGEVLQRLYGEPDLRDRPWIVWLDYDGALDERMLDDLRSIIEDAPSNTIMLTTFNAHEGSYARLANDGVQERREQLAELFGAAFPDDVPQKGLKGGRLVNLLADLTLEKFAEYANGSGRTGGFQQAFRMVYADGAPMVTVGGILPSRGNRTVIRGVVENADWHCILDEAIEAPPLTTLEALALQAQHPRDAPLTRAEVQSLGFDLREDQLRTFARYYRQYPSYARIA